VGVSFGAREEERRVVWGAARWGATGVPFIGAEGEGSDRTVEGNGWRWWSAMMVVEAAILGRDRWRSDEGGVLRPFQEWKGEEDDRARRAGWAGKRPRPSGSLVVAAQKEGRKSGPVGVEGEEGRGWDEFGAGPEFKRNSFRISIDF
jgi:hypothetical protein